MTHPEREKLRAFGLGKLDPAEALEIEAHISQCDECCRTLLHLSDDTFVDLVRRSEGGFEAKDPAPLGHEVTLSDSGQPSGRPLDLPAALADHPRYRLVELLGKGGMGDVYKAEHKLMGRPVALKVINRRLVDSPQAVGRFRREVQAAARLSHPNIVTAHDAEQAGDVHFLVMEYVDGRNLADLVQERGPLPVATACDYAQQAAEGLQCAFEAGMVHRDIKPHNLMVTRAGQVKILDFGLARFVSETATAEGEGVVAGHPLPVHLTSFGSAMGTPDYIAPEQSSDARSADARADIYALGCTLYFLLAGRPPFADESVVEKVRAHAERAPRPIRELRPEVPDGLAEVLVRMMAKDPGQRYQTPAEVAEALARFAGAPASPTTALSRPAGRKRPARRVLAAGLTAIFLVVAAIVVYVQLGKTTLKFEIEDPSLAIRFGDQRITVDNDGHAIGITPGGEQRFVVEQNGLEVEADSLTLKKGEKIALRVMLVGGKVAVIPSDSSVRVDRQSHTPALNPSASSPFDVPEAIRPSSPEEAQKLQASWAKRLGTEPATANSLGMSLRLMPPGQFQMGSSRDEIDLLPLEDWFFANWQRKRMFHESPKHRVRISRPFWLGAHEVTVGQFRRFIEATGYQTTAERDGNGGYGFADGVWMRDPRFNWRNPGFEQAEDHPVCNVSFEDADAFCRWLSRLEQKTYRLPTEAEWEYACRAGTSTWFYTGDRDEGLKAVANIADASLKARHAHIEWARRWDDGFPFTAPVGRYQPNAFSLFDMHGNAWEWCQDWYNSSFYERSPPADPRAQYASAPYHVFRGGGFDNYPGFARSADRYSSHSDTWRTQWAGFRVVCEIPREPAGETGAAPDRATLAPKEDPAAREFFRKFERTTQEQKSISLLYAGTLTTTKAGQAERHRYFGMWQTKPQAKTTEANWFTRRDGSRGMVTGLSVRNVDTFYDPPAYDFYINPVARSGFYFHGLQDLLEYRLWQPRRDAAAELGLSAAGLEAVRNCLGNYAWAMWPIENVRFGEESQDGGLRSVMYTLRPNKVAACEVVLWVDAASLAPRRRTVRFQVEGREFLADERYLALVTDEIPEPFGEGVVATRLAGVVVEAGRVARKTGEQWRAEDWIVQGETYRAEEPTLLFVGREGNIALEAGSEFQFDGEGLRLAKGRATAALLYFADLKVLLGDRGVTMTTATGTCGRAIVTFTPERVVIEEGAVNVYGGAHGRLLSLLREGVEYALEGDKLVAQTQRTLPPELPARFDEAPVLRLDIAGQHEKFLVKGRAAMHDGRCVVASQPGATSREDGEIVIHPAKIVGPESTFRAVPTTVIRVRYLLKGEQGLDLYLHNKTKDRDCWLNLPFPQQDHWTTLTFPVLDVGALHPEDQPAPTPGDDYDTVRFAVWPGSELFIDRLEVVEMAP
jgi:formylglycine-generating enzyme required for sulfatase activity/serine/threonine protein kinase